MKTILIANDDKLSRRILQTTLEKAGYRVIAVDDGVTAGRFLCQQDGPRLGCDIGEPAQHVAQLPARSRMQLYCGNEQIHFQQGHALGQIFKRPIPSDTQVRFRRRFAHFSGDGRDGFPGDHVHRGR